MRSTIETQLQEYLARKQEAQSAVAAERNAKYELTVEVIQAGMADCLTLDVRKLQRMIR
jgi:hypothetical protein